MEELLIQTIETDTPGFYSFGKWWLWKRSFIFWQHWGIERQSGRGNHWDHEWNKQMKHTPSKSYAWCSLETGIQSCMNSEMLSSSFLGSPNIFTKGASLWGILSFLTCLVLDRKDKRVPDNIEKKLSLNKLIGYVYGKHGVKYLFHSTEPHRTYPLFSFPPVLRSWARTAKGR